MLETCLACDASRLTPSNFLNSRLDSPCRRHGAPCHSGSSPGIWGADGTGGSGCCRWADAGGPRLSCWAHQRLAPLHSLPQRKPVRRALSALQVAEEPHTYWPSVLQGQSTVSLLLPLLPPSRVLAAVPLLLLLCLLFPPETRCGPEPPLLPTSSATARQLPVSFLASALAPPPFSLLPSDFSAHPAGAAGLHLPGRPAAPDAHQRQR